MGAYTDPQRRVRGDCKSGNGEGCFCCGILRGKHPTWSSTMSSQGLAKRPILSAHASTPRRASGSPFGERGWAACTAVVPANAIHHLFSHFWTGQPQSVTPPASRSSYRCHDGGTTCIHCQTQCSCVGQIEHDVRTLLLAGYLIRRDDRRWCNEDIGDYRCATPTRTTLNELCLRRDMFTNSLLSTFNIFCSQWRLITSPMRRLA